MTLPATPFPPRNFFAAFTDAHAHLPASAADDAAVRLPAGTRVLLNATRPGDFPRVAALAEKFPAAVVPAFGVHPWFADEWNAEAAKLLRRRLSDAPDAAAVGEIGLDRCRGNAPAQEKAFREQLEIAAEFRAPVSIHCVRAFGRTEETLRAFAEAGTLPPFLLHAYGGSPEQAKVFARLGGAFSAPRKPLPPECLVVPESDAPLSAR